jgi:hypothetical protein
MAFGYLDTQYIDLPDNLDPAYLHGLQTRAGVSFPQILSELDGRLGALNGALDPLVASLLYPTTDVEVDATGVPNFDIEEATERTVARPQTVDVNGHLLPIRAYDVATGFTEDGLMDLPLRKITQQFDAIVGGYRHLYRKAALTRLFDDSEVLVDRSSKTAVKSPGFAGSGTGDNAFTQAYPDGTALPGGYTHYYRDTTANRATVIKAARDRLKKWNAGPFDLIGSQTTVDAIVALGSPDFVPAGSALVRVGTGTAEALVDPLRYIGVYAGDIRVWMAVTDFTSDHAAIFKSFGALNPRNPLAWRYDERIGRNAYVRSRDLFPLANAFVKQKFGIGVSNRVAAALIKFASSGNYAMPTIS